MAEIVAGFGVFAVFVYQVEYIKSHLAEDIVRMQNRKNDGTFPVQHCFQDHRCGFFRIRVYDGLRLQLQGLQVLLAELCGDIRFGEDVAVNGIDDDRCFNSWAFLPSGRCQCRYGGNAQRHHDGKCQTYQSFFHFAFLLCLFQAQVRFCA